MGVNRKLMEEVVAEEKKKQEERRRIKKALREWARGNQTLYDEKGMRLGSNE